MFGIFLRGLKSGFFARFSPLFIYIVTAMRIKKRKKRAKNPPFQAPQKIPNMLLPTAAAAAAATTATATTAAPAR